MKKELQKHRNINCDDTRMEYAKSISIKDDKSASEGIRIALDYHKANHPDLDQPIFYNEE